MSIKFLVLGGGILGFGGGGGSAVFYFYGCDPDCLVQCPNSWIPPKSVGEGASSLFGGWPGSLENVCNPKVAPVQVWGCTGARDIFETQTQSLGPSSEKTTCSLSYRFIPTLTLCL